MPCTLPLPHTLRPPYSSQHVLLNRIQPPYTTTVPNHTVCNRTPCRSLYPYGSAVHYGHVAACSSWAGGRRAPLYPLPPHTPQPCRGTRLGDSLRMMNYCERSGSRKSTLSRSQTFPFVPCFEQSRATGRDSSIATDPVNATGPNATGPRTRQTAICDRSRIMNHECHEVDDRRLETGHGLILLSAYCSTGVAQPRLP